MAKASARTDGNNKNYISIESIAAGAASYDVTYQGKDNSEGEECDAIISSRLSVTSAIIPVSEIILTPETLSLTVGGTGKLNTTVLPENATDKTLMWRSDNTSIATVDDQGNVTAIAPGTVNIYVGSQQNTNAYASCKVTVSEAYTPITAIQGKGMLLLGVATTYDMAYGTDYTVTPSDATYKEPSDFNWTSSN
ncbi:MAG: Ig domain-containing protein, partial [Bacteroidales bacterium]|nr:Ig domain-containing protein [Bacteroidales bacterium]